MLQTLVNALAALLILFGGLVGAAFAQGSPQPSSGVVLVVLPQKPLVPEAGEPQATTHVSSLSEGAEDTLLASGEGLADPVRTDREAGWADALSPVLMPLVEAGLAIEVAYLDDGAAGTEGESAGDASLRREFAMARPLSSIDPELPDALLIVARGEDPARADALSGDTVLRGHVQRLARNNRVIAALDTGAAGLLGARDGLGRPIIEWRRVAVPPYLIGGFRGRQAYLSPDDTDPAEAVRDRNLITGRGLEAGPQVVEMMMLALAENGLIAAPSAAPVGWARAKSLRADERPVPELAETPANN